MKKLINLLVFLEMLVGTGTCVRCIDKEGKKKDGGGDASGDQPPEDGDEHFDDKL